MPQRKIIETGRGGLRFEIDWSTRHHKDAMQSLGCLSVQLAGRTVWPAPALNKNGVGITALWIELLEHLGTYWPYLTLEQGYPFHVTPYRPSKLDDELARRWEYTSDEQQAEEEELSYAFKISHNLADSSPGALRPDLWLVRDGGVFVVESIHAGESIVERIPADDVRRVLTGVGDTIAERLSESADSRSRDAVASWRNRHAVDFLEQVRIATGLSEEYLERARGKESFEAVFSDPDSSWAGDNVALDVSYRLKGRIPAERLRTLLDHIRQVQETISTPLVQFSEAAEGTLFEIEATWSPPYIQGTKLAQWTRRRLNLNGQRAEPEQLLRRWGVQMEEQDLNSTSIDAVAFWPHGRRPGVLWNAHPKHRDNVGARRATLAHEICHLLVDRTALPLSAVVGGAMDRGLNQRANAFAAEFLCPKEEVRIDFDRNSRDVAATIDGVTKRFGVSNQLAALQLSRACYHSEAKIQKAIEKFGPPDAHYPWSQTEHWE